MFSFKFIYQSVYFRLPWVFVTAQASGVAVSAVHSPAAVCGLLIAGASLVAEFRLKASVVVAPGLQSTGSIFVHGLSFSVARGILPDQGLNLRLLHWQMDSLPLSHQGSPS